MAEDLKLKSSHACGRVTMVLAKQTETKLFCKSLFVWWVARRMDPKTGSLFIFALNQGHSAWEENPNLALEGSFEVLFQVHSQV